MVFKRSEAAEPESLPALGHKLQSARQKKNLDIAQVAQQLHLSRAIVQALEEEDFTPLPARVFVRGYYKNYARLLGLDENEILAEFDRLYPENPQSRIVQKKTTEPKGKPPWFYLISATVVIGLISLSALWWQAQSKPVIEPLPVAEEPIKPVTMAQASPQKDTVAEPVPPAPMPEVPTEVKAESKPIAPPADVVEKPIAQKPPLAPQKEEKKEEKKIANNAFASLVKSLQVELYFAGKSWVDIRDQHNQFRIRGLQKAGKTIALKGEPPYRMVIGNAHQVEIRVDGEPFDFSPYIRGNVAKFNFNPEEALY